MTEPLPRMQQNVAVVNPTDRIRWGPIWAGFLVAISTWIVLSVLGAAIGLSIFDRGDSPRAFGWGAAIWGAVSFILSFILGGWVTARSSALRNESNGVLNGVMVWALGIPLLTFLVLGGTLVPAMSAMGQQQPGDRAMNVSARIDSSGAMTAAQTTGPGDWTRTASGAAWTTLIWLLLGLGSAALGGYLGSADTRRRYTTSGTSTV